ncbi:MAG: ATP-binding protein [Myxococcales bacterium]
MQGAPSTREAARIQLIRGVHTSGSAHERALVNAIKLSARTLDVERVSVWLIDEREANMVCRILYKRASNSLGGEQAISLATCPAYAKALREWRCIAADDAFSDPRTRELDGYLRTRGVTAMLDSPIYQQGLPVGILCHECMTPGGRAWSKRDSDFAATVADMVGLYFEQAERERLDRALLEAQTELERARVMESLGRMATTVAHDFNNILMAVYSRCALANLPKSDDASARASFVREVEALVEQGARLVNHLTSFAQPAHGAVAPGEQADARQVLHGMKAFLSTLEVEGVSVRVRYPVGNLRVPVTRSELEQIITNLAVNARDAMLGGGKLTIEVSLLQRDNGQAGSIRLTVADTGVGMDEQTQRRVFEPFFSTKGDRRARGLGLATVYKLVTNSGGSVRLASGLGRGTTVVLEWPRPN